MLSPISAKIPKGSESAFPTQRIFHFYLTPAGLMRLERNSVWDLFP
jgi:hypothetical protein